MKKIGIILLLALSASLFAAHYSRIGKYNNVEVKSISHRGIRITHSSGSCYITDKDLSATDKRRLKNELQIYREKLAKYQQKQTAKKSQQQEILAELSSQLPKMSQTEIEKWFSEEIGKELSDPESKNEFSKKFALVENCDSFLNRIFDRLDAIQSGELEELYQNCVDQNNKTIYAQTAVKVGIALNNKGFNKAFNNKYTYAKKRGEYLKKIRSLEAKNIAAEKEARRIAEEKAREARRIAAEKAKREEMARRAKLANEYWRQLLDEFVPTANQYRQYAFSQSRTADDFLRRLINHREKAVFVEQNLMLTESQKNFVSSIKSAGFFAEKHFQYLELAGKFTNIYQFRSSEECIESAKDSRRNAVKFFDISVRAFNNMR